MTTSSKVDQLASGSTFPYAVSLRVRHPNLDPQILTQTLHLQPLHSWKAGEPRRSVSGAALGGEHRDSYWSAPVPAQAMGSGGFPLEVFLNQQLVQLGRHGEFLERLQAEGGQVSLLIEIARIENAVLTLTPSVSRKLAEFNLELEFQFIGG